MMEKEKFYLECARLLGINYEYTVPYHNCGRANRWTNREPGNGRFEGFGLISYFGPTFIKISFHSPKINKTAKSLEEVFEVLRNLPVAQV